MEKEKNYKSFTLFRLLSFSGARKGEILALSWNDINFKENEIRINKALSRGENNRIIIQTPKTKSSIRSIKMDDITMAILKDWRKRQKQELLIL